MIKATDPRVKLLANQVKNGKLTLEEIDTKYLEAVKEALGI